MGKVERRILTKFSSHEKKPSHASVFAPRRLRRCLGLRCLRHHFSL